MFITDKFIFIELHKTGSSHIVRMLSSLMAGEQVGKHIAAESEHFNSNKVFLGSIRNPWDWYLSLWGYGCDDNGAFYEAVTSAKPRLAGHGWRQNIRHALYSLANEPYRNVEAWKDCYSQVEDPARFRKWVHMIHDPQFRADFGEGYDSSSLSSISGLFSFRYLKLFCRNFAQVETNSNLSAKDLEEFDAKNCYIDHFVRNENLEEDFLAIMQQYGINISEQKKKQLRSLKKTNTSSRKSDAGFYYDTETLQLIQESECLIIDKFGYNPPKT